MLISNFLYQYERIVKGNANLSDVEALYQTLLRDSDGTEAEFILKGTSPRMRDRLEALDILVTDFTSDDSLLLHSLFPEADTALVKAQLENLLTTQADTLAYSQSHFGIFLSAAPMQFLEKAVGKTTLPDIQLALKSYANLYEAQMRAGKDESILSDGELYTLWRSTKEPKYRALINARNSKDPLIVGGYASVEVVDREGHLITLKALENAFMAFMKSFRTRNIMIAHCLVPETLVWKAGPSAGYTPICGIQPEPLWHFS